MSEVLYIDRLVRISETSITFFNYYYPSSKSLTVPFHNVKKVVSLMPTLLNGKYRLWGTSSFFTWFPKDFKRSTRDKIFILYRKNKRVKIGFTAVDSQKVFEIILEKQLF
ncbi:MAG: hypothetical protein WAR59_04255 [Ignavibacteriaceae bacterium]